MTDACWYCGRAGDLLCDGVIGHEQVPGRCVAANCPNPAAVIVGASEPAVVCESCAGSPEYRRKRTRVPFDPAATRPVTCDASACRRCAARFGWRQLFSAIVCTRSGRGRGCHDVSVHRCHAHVAAEEPGPEGATIEEIRAVVRAACAELFKVTPPAAIVHRDRKPNRDSWRENADLFRRELLEGRRWQEWAAAELAIRGLRVEVPDFAFRDRIEDADEFTRYDQDLTIRGTAVGDVVLEVKSRPLHFLDPAGYPYETALVDTVDGWGAKQIEPRAVLLVSRPARRMLVVASATRPSWTIQRRHDQVRNTWADFYECPRTLLRPMEWLVRRLMP